MNEKLRSDVKCIRGYSTHSSFSGMNIPVSVQNLMMRDYASRNNLTFLLGADEFKFKNSYARLKSLLSQLKNSEGLVMCSLFMLPIEVSERLKIYEKIVSSESSLHFILEKTVLSDKNDILNVEEIIRINSVLQYCPISIPFE